MFGWLRRTPAITGPFPLHLYVVAEDDAGNEHARYDLGRELTGYGDRLVVNSMDLVVNSMDLVIELEQG